MLLNRETELVPPDRLTPHPKNARRGDVDAIAESIRRLESSTDARSQS